MADDDGPGEPPAQAGLTLKEQVDAWGAATTQLRDVVKWIAAAFSGLGALLIGTAPLSGLGDVDPTPSKLAAPILFGLLALVAVTAIVWKATELLTPSRTTLHHVAGAPEFSDLRAEVAADSLIYLGTWATDVPGFLDAQYFEHKILKELLDRQAVEPAGERRTKLQEAIRKQEARVTSIGRYATRLLALAGFHHLSRRFNAAKPAMFAAAWTTVIGIAGFLLTVDGSDGAAAAAPAPTPALVAITDDAPTTLTDLLGQGCPNPFEAMVLSGGTQGPWELSLDDQDCADGTLRVASDHATVLLQFHR